MTTPHEDGGTGYLEACVRVGDYLHARSRQVAGGNIGDEIGTVAVTVDGEVRMATLAHSDLLVLLRHGRMRPDATPLAAGLRTAASGVALVPLAALLQRLADWIDSASLVDLVECGWLNEAQAVVQALSGVDCGDPEHAGMTCDQYDAALDGTPQGEDQTPIPGNPYPDGDPRGWAEYDPCRSHLCAVQRQHTARCRAERGVAG